MLLYNDALCNLIADSGSQLLFQALNFWNVPQFDTKFANNLIFIYRVR